MISSRAAASAVAGRARVRTSRIAVTTAKHRIAERERERGDLVAVEQSEGQR